ncbi:MAG: sodium:solute symporter family protein, partial [Candidatus Eremiobacteraeota bacterium]|nr:sodium:solute symporter family protein [Candidatus Eremiobacteraeota bacterium]
IYTTFTFLGAAGWAYARGAPTFYILCYGVVAYIISYFLLPPIWRIAKQRQLLTGPDFFRDRYDSIPLGVITAVVSFIFIVPYVTLQLTGLQILLTIAGYDRFDATIAVGIAFVLMTSFVYLAGLRGTAWASVVKDVLVLGAVVFAGIVLPVHFFGSPANVLTHVLRIRPDWLTLKHGAAPQGELWFISTVLLTAMGFYAWPQSLSASYSAKNEDTLRRNAIFLPLYNLMIVLVFFAGCTALLVFPGLQGKAADQSFMLLVQKFYPPWVLGAIAAAGCLAGLVPASGQLLGAASVISKNVLGDWAGVATSDQARTAATRICVLGVAALALVVWLTAKATLVDLLLVAYSGITQFFPGMVFALAWKGATARGVGSGIICGVITVAILAYAKIDAPFGINAGLFALIVNTCISVLLSVAPSGNPRKTANAR